jgi:hypothetical protein
MVYVEVLNNVELCRILKCFMNYAYECLPVEVLNYDYEYFMNYDYECLLLWQWTWTCM